MTQLFFIRFAWTMVLMITTHIAMGQSELVSNNSEYTITKRLLSIEDDLASHELFCGLQDKAGFPGPRFVPHEPKCHELKTRNHL